jgi:hypothetical protein
MSQEITLDSVLLLGFAEFFSALLTVCAPPLPEIIRYLLPGTLVGVSLSLCLWSRTILHSFWKTLIIVAASSIALLCSALACVGIEYFPRGRPFTIRARVSRIYLPRHCSSGFSHARNNRVGKETRTGYVFTAGNGMSPVIRRSLSAVLKPEVKSDYNKRGYDVRDAAAYMGVSVWQVRQGYNLVN